MWTPFRFFVGQWEGTGQGQPGSGKYERTYEFILNDKFLLVKNKSIYPPSEQSAEGEVHEDLGLISYDKARKTFILRQFHVEGFVNQYILDHISPDEKEFSFVTEIIENIPPGWRARESYILHSNDEFSETFSLAEPGKDFEVYTQCTLKRKEK